MKSGTYLVRCPALNEQLVCHSFQEANYACYAMHMKRGMYAYIEDWLGWTDFDYGNPEDLVLND